MKIRDVNTDTPCGFIKMVVKVLPTSHTQWLMVATSKGSIGHPFITAGWWLLSLVAILLGVCF
jgi:hypothetical protein